MGRHAQVNEVLATGARFTGQPEREKFSGHIRIRNEKPGSLRDKTEKRPEHAPPGQIGTRPGKNQRVSHALIRKRIAVLKAQGCGKTSLCPRQTVFLSVQGRELLFAGQSQSQRDLRPPAAVIGGCGLGSRLLDRKSVV